MKTFRRALVVLMGLVMLASLVANPKAGVTQWELDRTMDGVLVTLLCMWVLATEFFDSGK